MSPGNNQKRITCVSNKASPIHVFSGVYEFLNKVSKAFTSGSKLSFKYLCLPWDIYAYLVDSGTIVHPARQCILQDRVFKSRICKRFYMEIVSISVSASNNVF